MLDKCTETPKKTTKKKTTTPTPKPAKKKAEISLIINDIPLEVHQLSYSDRVGDLGVKVYRGSFMLSKEQAIAFRGISKYPLFHSSKLNIEVRYDGKCRTCDRLRDCRVLSIENVHDQGKDHLESITFEIGSIEYGHLE